MFKKFASIALCGLLSACGGSPMEMDSSTSSAPPIVTQNPALNALQGNWGRLASGPAVFKIQAQDLIWFKGNKSYPLTLQGTSLVGTITDTRGITCQVVINSAGNDLRMAQKNCVDAAGSGLTLAQSNITFVKVTTRKDYNALSCEQLQSELMQLESTIKQKDEQYQKLKTNNSAWAKEQRDRLLSDNSYTVYRDISVISKQKGCPVTTQFDNPMK